METKSELLVLFTPSPKKGFPFLYPDISHSSCWSHVSPDLVDLSFHCSCLFTCMMGTICLNLYNNINQDRKFVEWWVCSTQRTVVTIRQHPPALLRMSLLGIKVFNRGAQVRSPGHMSELRRASLYKYYKAFCLNLYNYTWKCSPFVSVEFFLKCSAVKQKRK